ncbi:MAG TPA: hypothetical protein VI704_03050, partial [Bacteroidota bacterium]|nr:hypothetical protein [Bacteroidota bacterium]
MKKTKQKHQSPELNVQKKRIFFAITVALPFVLLIGSELLLRWFNYGPDLSLFTQHEIRGQKYYLMNPEVKSRYFGTLNFAPTTSPEYFLASKPAGTYRIFCLGGSTTVGYPYWYNGSFSSYLRDRLKAAFPQRNLEIINLGMTATNSFTVLDMARELVACQPDLIIVYDGHNEFYGALGVASQQTVGSSRIAAQLYLRMVHVRTFQFLRDWIQTILGFFSSPDRPRSRSTMMETLARNRYVSFGSSLYESAFSAFKENLEDLKAICREEDIPLLIGTQVSNLRDRPPFISNNSLALLPTQKA